MSDPRIGDLDNAEPAAAVAPGDLVRQHADPSDGGLAVHLVGGSIGPISGTITADQGAPGPIDQPWPVILSNGEAPLGTVDNPIIIAGQGTPGAPTVLVVTVQGLPDGSPVPISGNVSILGAPIVQGLGTPGAQAGGVVTIQGDPSGTAIPISGSVTIAGGATAANQVTQIAAEQSTATATAALANEITATGILVNATGPSGTVLATETTLASVNVNTASTSAGVATTNTRLAGGLPAALSGSGALKTTGVGTAGTADPGVMTVQGIAGGTAIPVSGSVTITGGATAANQATQITAEQATQASVASIDGKTPSLGQQLAAASSPVVLTAAQLATIAAPVVSGTVAVSNFPATQPVSGTVTVNQGTSPWVISAASLPLPTGAATAALQSSVQAALGAAVPANANLAGFQTAGGNIVAPLIDATTRRPMMGVIQLSPTGVPWTNRRGIFGTAPVLIKSGGGKLQWIQLCNQGAATSIVYFVDTNIAPVALGVAAWFNERSLVTIASQSIDGSPMGGIVFTSGLYLWAGNNAIIANGGAVAFALTDQIVFDAYYE